MKSGNDNILHKEIAQMIRDIETVKHEMFALSSGEQTNKQAISDASLHLDTVIKSTEEATNRIMDAASEIGTLANSIGDEKGQALQDICTRIYEACNFQDLASQRITKVIKLISMLEAHITNMLKVLEITNQMPLKKATGDEKSLLNGPALPANAASQDDIDALFKSLGE